MARPRAIVVLLAALAVVAAACGDDGGDATTETTTPDAATTSPVTVPATNVGAIEHEATFGSHHQQDEFAQMDDHGDHGDAGHHGEIMGITLGPDETASLTTTFDEPGEMFIGCHLPGHYDAGMVTSFTVT